MTPNQKKSIVWGVLGVSGLAMTALWVSLLVAATAGIVMSTCAALTWAVRSLLIHREASLKGRTSNRLLGLMWQARRRLGRNFAQDGLYLVLGAHGVGKSSFIQAASGPSVEVIEPKDAPEPQARLVRAQGRCFLEVPSRLLDPGQNHLWRSFFRTLWLVGVARRIKGIIWLTDVSELGHNALPDAALDRQMMAAMVQTLGMRPPIYMMLSRCDAIPGFIDTFGHAALSTLQAPWGFAIDDLHETALTTGHRFDALMDTLRGYCMAQLSQVERPDQRAPLYLFPQYVATLRRGLTERIEATFGTQSSPRGPRLGGIYLVAAPPPAPVTNLTTAALRSSTPVKKSDDLQASAQGSQAVLWQPARLKDYDASVLTAPMPPIVAMATDNRQGGFFIDGFVRAVLPADQAMDPTVQASGALSMALRAPGHLVAAAVVLVLMGAMVVSVSGTMAQLTVIHRAVSVPWQEHDVDLQGELMPLLRALQPPDAHGMSRAKVSEMMGFGCSALRPTLSALYGQLLQRDLIGPLLEADGRGLQRLWRSHAYAGNAPSPEEATQAAAQLRTHLLLTGPKQAYEPSLRARQGDWLIRALQRRLRGVQADVDASAIDCLQQHLTLYTQLLQAHPELLPARDESLVSRTRALLHRRPLADLLVDGLVYDTALAEPSVRLDDIITSGMVPLSGSVEVPAAFTKDGYDRHAKAWLQAQESDSDGWVFWETQPKLAKRRSTAQEVRRRYFGRYTESWRHFLAGLMWQKPTDAHSGHGMLVALTRSEPPPLSALWQALARNTSLTQEIANENEGKGVLSSLRRRLVQQDRAAQAQQDEVLGHRLSAGPQQVGQAFAPLVAFGSTPLGVYQDLLGELRGAVESYLEDPQDTESLLAQLRRTRTQAAGLIQTASTGLGSRGVLQGLLLVPLDHMTQALTRGVRAQVVDAWCPAVAQPFAHLAKRYPFDAFGPDAAIEDVAAYFHPEEGQPWLFFQQHLAQDMRLQANRFVFDEKLGGVMKRTYSPHLLRYYERLHEASQALFGGAGHNQLAVDFDMRLVMDEELWEATLDVEGQQAHLAPGQHETAWQRVRWPSKQSATPPSHLTMTGVGGIKERLDFEGPWALWHLLESGQVRLDKVTQTITVSWRPGGILGHVRLDIRPTRANNAFFLSHGRSKDVGVFAHLRDRGLTPPSSIGIVSKSCSMP